MNDVRSVVLASYDPLWPAEYEAEAARIRHACEDLPLRLEHIGSTAVSGLCAKPILDILAGCPPRADRAPYIAAIRSLGYTHRGALGIPGRNYFRRGTPRTHHLHLVSWSSAIWEDHVAFRDALRRDSALGAEYAALKRQLATQHPGDRALHSSAKGPFIRAVVRRTRYS